MIKNEVKETLNQNQEIIIPLKEYKKEKSSFRLSRNLDDIKISGVCSGLAHLIDVDTTIIRIAVLFLGLAGGGNIFLIYILLAFLLPGEHLG